ncbi:hypothetical protein BDV96DRAFT_644222 [Lophiotrema nucula]|uniref:Uncharacterized protein n=1 Tax=Lophiotrema nucula TaxID=690887 RepID=A0A6A5ZF97_9PLEO|nr:hypothetical protein BDV96DRAFT_644222 [Lophiotrema nucula]
MDETAVSSFYGPGAFAAWICAFASVFVSWTFNKIERQKGNITPDLIAVLSYPLIAVCHGGFVAMDPFKRRTKTPDAQALNQILFKNDYGHETFDNIKTTYDISLYVSAICILLALLLSHVLGRNARRLLYKGPFYSLISIMLLAFFEIWSIATAWRSFNWAKFFAIMPKTPYSLADLDQAVPLGVGLVTLILSIWDAIKSRKKRTSHHHTSTTGGGHVPGPSQPESFGQDAQGAEPVQVPQPTARMQATVRAIDNAV